MMPFHVRHQRPVGQGCFHTAEVRGASGPVRYVYDCGAMSTYQSQLATAVDSYHAETGKAAIDLLFVSHMHADHVSGLEQLCTPVDVGTIVMPLVNVADRLVAFARTAFEDPAAADDPFYRSLIADPVAAVSRFDPDQVILVTRGTGPAPGGEADTRPEPLGPDGDGPRGRRDGEEAWRLSGRGQVVRLDQNTPPARRRRGTAVYTMPDTRAFDLAGADQLSWLLAPYVDPTVAADRTKFISALGTLLGKTTTTVEAFLAADRDGLLLLLAQYKDVLAAAYHAVVKKNLNLTSLCLYSGPAHGAWPECAWRSKLGENPSLQPPWSAVRPSGSLRVGWIGTGDAALKQVARHKALLQHYASHLARVTTLLLPHHGSAHNFHDALLAGMSPRLTIASAAPYSTWRHPGTAVLQAACARGVPLWVVNHSLASVVVEWVWADAHRPMFISSGP